MGRTCAIPTCSLSMIELFLVSFLPSYILLAKEIVLVVFNCILSMVRKNGRIVCHNAADMFCGHPLQNSTLGIDMRFVTIPQSCEGL